MARNLTEKEKPCIFICEEGEQAIVLTPACFICYQPDHVFVLYPVFLKSHRCITSFVSGRETFFMFFVCFIYMFYYLEITFKYS